MKVAKMKLTNYHFCFALTALLTIGGCGDSNGRSCDSNGSSSTESNATATTSVTVSAAYVLKATVYTSSQYAVESGEGSYRFYDANITDIMIAEQGIVDTNNNGIADGGEPYAPSMKAPGGYANINPFTTLLAAGKNTLQIKKKYPNAYYYRDDFDFDAVVAGNDELEIAKETAIALLTLSRDQSIAAE